MKTYRRLLDGAGFAQLGTPLAVLLPVAVITSFAAICLIVTGLSALAFATAVILTALTFEALNSRARYRQRQLVKLLPEVIESVQSALQASLGPSEALCELALNGPKDLRPVFASARHALEVGVQFESVANWLKRQFAVASADEFLELLKLANQQGGMGLNESLGTLANQIRAEANLYGEISAKQGWVASTAKLALIAPWVIVLMLTARPENAAYYNSPAGVAVLLSGLIVCAGAYWLIKLFAVLPHPIRVFADA